MLGHGGESIIESAYTVVKGVDLVSKTESGRLRRFECCAVLESYDIQPPDHCSR